MSEYPSKASLSNDAQEHHHLNEHPSEVTTPPVIGSPPMSPEDATPAPSAAGARAPRYTLEGKLGQGGMGSVYRARDEVLPRTVALKFIHADSLTPAARVRFEAEARAVAKLDHPHIIKIFDVGEMPTPEGGPAVPFLVLELVGGGRVSDIADCKWKMADWQREAARLIRLLARAVAHCHERGIVHRDLQPGNVLFADRADEPALNTAWGCPKITDFGLARELRPGSSVPSSNGVAGTPAYMSPEQADGLEADEPADVWALGVILYQLLAGRRPFEAEPALELLRKIRQEEPTALRGLDPEVSVALERICMACLNKAPAQRPTAEQLAEQLEKFLDGRRGWSRRRLLLTGLGLSVPLVLGVGWLARRDRPKDDETGPVTPPVTKPLRISPLRVRHYAKVGDEAEDRGPIGDKVFAARVGDAVTVTVELSEPGYFYLIGFNFNGKEQLLWPADDIGEARPEVEPAKLQRLRFPLGEHRIHLDDDEKSGLQVYAVAASREPLPAYQEWKQERGEAGWKSLLAGKMVYEADAKGAYAVKAGLTVDRSSVKPLAGVPPLAKLCQALTAGGVELVEAFAFPVLAKEGGR